MSLPPEILKKVKLLEISTRKIVNNVFAGEYQTTFKGQGMTFAEFREYIPGDDVRHISWPLTARAGKPFIKKFEEERELTLMLVVDVSGSSDFGSGKYFKGEAMAHLAALLAFSASRNKDQVGLLLVSDQVEHYVPPQKGVGHIQRILRDLYYYKPKSHGTRIEEGLKFLQGILRKRSVIFLISDFMDEGFDSSLRLLGRKHDVTAVVVQDDFEKKLPDVGVLELFDAETGEHLVVDTSSEDFQSGYTQQFKIQQEKRDKILKKSQVGRIDISTRGDLVEPLLAYFRARHRK